MRYLSGEEVLYIHFAVAQGGGGVRDLDLLLSAVARPRSSVGERDAYQTIYEKAAALLDTICRNHPFVDGNKRTGITAASLFLAVNGYRVTASNDELVAFTVAVAAERPEIGEIARWFEDHSVQEDASPR